MNINFDMFVIRYTSVWNTVVKISIFLVRASEKGRTNRYRYQIYEKKKYDKNNKRFTVVVNWYLPE